MTDPIIVYNHRTGRGHSFLKVGSKVLRTEVMSQVPTGKVLWPGKVLWRPSTSVVQELENYTRPDMRPDIWMAGKGNGKRSMLLAQMMRETMRDGMHKHVEDMMLHGHTYIEVPPSPPKPEPKKIKRRKRNRKK